jgi:TIR domain/FHA domain
MAATFQTTCNSTTTKTFITTGRGSVSTINVGADYPRVSRLHAKIEQIGETTFTIVDLESSSGVEVWLESRWIAVSAATLTVDQPFRLGDQFVAKIEDLHRFAPTVLIEHAVQPPVSRSIDFDRPAPAPFEPEPTRQIEQELPSAPEIGATQYIPTAPPPRAERTSASREDNVFLSYRRDDSSDAAGRLFERLSRTFSSARIFMDVEKISPGRDFVQAINERVSECWVMLVVIGPAWLDARDQTGKRRLDNPLFRHCRSIPHATGCGDVVPISCRPGQPARAG